MNSSKRRNWTANAAIMRKGGVHEKSNKAKRQKDKQSFKRKIRAEQFGSFDFSILSTSQTNHFHKIFIRHFLQSNFLIILPFKSSEKRSTTEHFATFVC